MKTGTIIAGMVGVALYGLTVAIAVDQVKTAKSSVRETAAKLLKSEAVLREAQADLRKAQSQKTEAEEKVRLAMDGIDRMKAASDAVVAAYKSENEILKKTNEIRRTINLATASTVPPVNAPVRVSAPIVTEVTIPVQPWIPPHRHMMAKLIKDRAVKEWKDDYRMIEHEIGAQTKALDQLVELNQFAGNRDLLAKAAKSWKDDYRMMLHEFETQAEAKKRLGR